MYNYIDLSHSIYDKMPIHPYDDGVKLYQDRFLDKHKYNNSRLETGMHAGTHIDVPRHFLNIDTYVDEIPLDRFIGRGCLINVRNEETIDFKEEYYDKIKEHNIVFILTGHDANYGKENYFDDHPLVTKRFAEFLITRKIKILGMDMAKPDKYPFEIHKILFENDIFIIENLTNLEKLVDIDEFQVIAFPLKIKAEASLVRVVAQY